MHTVTINGRAYQVPARWNELERGQLLKLAPLAFTAAPTLLVRARVLAVLLHVSSRWRLFWQLRKLTAADWGELRVVTDWFFQKATLTKNLVPVLTTPVLRLRKPGGGSTVLAWPERLLGPGEMLSGVSFEEFIDAEGHYDAWRKGDETALARLVATLYRPQRRNLRDWQRHADYNNDDRTPYNPTHASRRLLRVAELAVGELMAVALYYDSCRSRLVARYKDTIFRPGDGKPEPAKMAWTKTLRALAGELTSFDAVAKLPLGTVLFDFDQRIIENDKREEELEKLSRK